MAYSRFFDSDIYIYPHVGGWIECQACWLNERADEYSLFSMSEKIYDDKHLIEHIGQHRQLGHNIPDGLEEEILADPDRYGKMIGYSTGKWSDDDDIHPTITPFISPIR